MLFFIYVLLILYLKEFKYIQINVIMGIDLHFDDTDLHFSCSYGYWNILRTSIVQTFIIYLTDWVSKNSFDEDSWKNHSYVEIKNLLDENNSSTFVDINDYSIFFEKYIDCLACFGFLGVHALIKKSDCEGYYSCGNAMDVYILINKIKKFIPVKDDYKTIMNLKKIFKYSIDKKKSVTIS
jgi:hypothetical protein